MPGRRLITALALSLLVALPLPAFSNAFPTQPVRFIVPFPPGGSADALVRMLAQRMSAAWGQPVVVENKPGAGTVIGVDTVARSAPNGHTIGLVIPSFAVNPSITPQMPYDTLKDLAGVTQISTLPIALFATPGLPVNDIAELIAYGKKNPKSLSYGSAGTGSTSHLAGQMMNQMAGIDMVHVPYKGSSQMLPDLLSGQVMLAFDNMPTALAQVRAGKLRPLGVTSAERWADNPEIPTLAETLPTMVATSWQGVFAPAGTPEAVLDKLSASLQRILKSPDTIARFRELGTNASAMTRAEFGAFVKAETARWAEVVRRAGASAN